MTDMSYLFNSCSKLVSLPEISKWNFNKVTKMKLIFHNYMNIKIWANEIIIINYFFLSLFFNI